MWELVLVSLVTVGGALLGFRWWLDRLHPQVRQSDTGGFERQLAAIQERLEAIELTRTLRNRRNDDDE